jgi:hypothetical protein
MRVAANAPNFKISVTSVERVTDRWRRLRRSLVAKHASIPSLTRQPISLLPRLLGTLGCGAYGGAIDGMTGLGGHAGMMTAQLAYGKPLELETKGSVYTFSRRTKMAMAETDPSTYPGLTSFLFNSPLYARYRMNDDLSEVKELYGRMESCGLGDSHARKHVLRERHKHSLGRAVEEY